MSLTPFTLKILLLLLSVFSLFILRSFSNECNTALLFLVNFIRVCILKRKGTDSICSVKPRWSCVAWLTGPRLRFVNVQWSVGNNSITLQDSFPSNSAPNKSFLWIFPGLQNCRDSKRLSTCPMFGSKLRQLVAFPHYSHLMHFGGQRTQEVETKRFLIRRQIKMHIFGWTLKCLWQTTNRWFTWTQFLKVVCVRVWTGLTCMRLNFSGNRFF